MVLPSLRKTAVPGATTAALEGLVQRRVTLDQAAPTSRALDQAAALELVEVAAGRRLACAGELA
jgi:hypothetical protein